jgi:hypothetical protein
MEEIQRPAKHRHKSKNTAFFQHRNKRKIQDKGIDIPLSLQAKKIIWEKFPPPGYPLQIRRPPSEGKLMLWLL